MGEKTQKQTYHLKFKEKLREREREMAATPRILKYYGNLIDKRVNAIGQLQRLINLNMVTKTNKLGNNKNNDVDTYNKNATTKILTFVKLLIE